MTTLFLATTLGISVIMALPPQCGDFPGGRFIGCYLIKNPNWVYVSPKLEGYEKTWVIVHEVGHSQCVKLKKDYTEKCADDWARKNIWDYRIDDRPRIFINLQK